MPDMRHKLNKETAERHFPNWTHGGKGQHARKGNAQSRAAYRDNWDRIFKAKDNGSNQGS
jgi:hypothetical protein